MAVAAAGLAAACLDGLRRSRGRVAGARAVLLVGPGHNGGDALLAGRGCGAAGSACSALLCAPRHHEPGAAALRRAGGRVVALPDGPLPAPLADELAVADLVVDGVLGIGAAGAVRGPAATVLQHLLAGARPPLVVACDLPSGLDPATGAVEGPVLAADLTVTFGVAKPGLLLPEARPLVGRLVVVPLGLRPHLPARPALARLRVPAARDEPADVVGGAWPWSWRTADKYARGVLGVAAGEAAYPGAAVLVARAAAGAGVGMVRLVPPEDAPGLAALVLQAVPEVVVQPLGQAGRVQAWVAGPGTSGPEDPRVAHVLLRADEPAVVDAGALAGLGRAVADGTLHDPGRLLLTPHAGELDRLLEALDEPSAAVQGPWEAARAAARRTGATVLLKGPDTLVVGPGGRTVVVPGGPPSLATAGAGDVLAGLAGTLLAAGLAPHVAGVLAAHVHAVAAWRAAGGPSAGAGDGAGPLRAGAVADALAGVVAGARPRSWDHG